MRILFIFSRHSKNKNDSTLTRDLADSFHKLGHEIVVATMNERRNNTPTTCDNEHGYRVLRVKTANYFNTNKVEKIYTILSLPKILKNGVIEYLGHEKFDLIITHTPFMASAKIIRPLKKHFNCPAFLLLWDLFPQNAADLGIIKNKLIINYFKYQEKTTLQSYEKIFCTSLGNVKYLKENYLYLDHKQIDFQYNYAQVKPKPIIDKPSLRAQYGYTMNDFIVLFGGNMGLPQKLENLLALAEKSMHNAPQYKFLLIGSGTELPRIKELAVSRKLNNIRFIDQIPREEYECLSSICDVGLVSLDERFTIPNFPSKTADYFKLGLPILASLDSVAITDYGYFLTDIAKAGVYAHTLDLDALFNQLEYLSHNSDKYAELAHNGRKFYEEVLDSDKAASNIVNTYFEFKNSIGSNLS